ncbi:MAG: hypothetical protein ACK5LL_06940 [Suipraeoptans sp.]
MEIISRVSENSFSRHGANIGEKQDEGDQSADRWKGGRQGRLQSVGGKRIIM